MAWWQRNHYSIDCVFWGNNDYCSLLLHLFLSPLYMSLFFERKQNQTKNKSDQVVQTTTTCHFLTPKQSLFRTKKKWGKEPVRLCIIHWIEKDFRWSHLVVNMFILRSCKSRWLTTSCWLQRNTNGQVFLAKGISPWQLDQSRLNAFNLCYNT